MKTRNKGILPWLLSLVAAVPMVAAAGGAAGRLNSEFSPGVNTFSDGYRLGIVEKVSRKGTWPVYSTEIKMQIGLTSGYVLAKKRYDDKNDQANVSNLQIENSAEPPKTDGTGKSEWIQISPFNFSADKDEQDYLSGLVQHKYVMIHYAQKQIKNPLQDTDYQFVNAFKTREMPFYPASYQTKEDKKLKSNGVRGGKIVKVSRKGTVCKTWEAQIQLGDGGNQFHLVTIPDERLARYAVLAMASGLNVKVYYGQASALDKLTEMRVCSETDYDIFKIELNPQELQKFNASQFIEVPKTIIEDKEQNLDTYLWEHFVNEK